MPKGSRRTISRRVVSRRVVGSANPVAKWGRQSKQTCWDSISGFFVGIILFFVTFALPYCAATVEKDSKDIAKLDPIAAEAASTLTGKALVQGTISTTNTIEPPMGSVDGPVLAYHYTLQRFETWEETHTETRTAIENGKEVEYTEEVTEEVSDWVTKDEEKKWAQLVLGKISINPDKCEIQLPWEQIYFEEYTESISGDQYREEVKVVKGAKNVLLACELSNGQVVPAPDFYVLTTKSQEELVAAKHEAEETNRWLLIVLSVILWAASFNLMLGPAMILLNIIPIQQLSGCIRGVITFVSLIVAVLITAITYFAIRYWWLIVILLVAASVALIVMANRQRQAQPELENE